MFSQVVVFVSSFLRLIQVRDLLISVGECFGFVFRWKKKDSGTAKVTDTGRRRRGFGTTGAEENPDCACLLRHLKHSMLLNPFTIGGGWAGHLLTTQV